jgi:predicted nucleic acid-binding protein
MKRLFADTAGWVACADESDPAHKAAVQARDRWLADGGALVTTDYVIDETLTLLRIRLGMGAAETWWRQIEGSGRLTWEWVGVERAERARAIFFQFRDKDFSFTDCTSFVVMKELKIRQALTTDKHFGQMGYEMLPQTR